MRAPQLCGVPFLYPTEYSDILSNKTKEKFIQNLNSHVLIVIAQILTRLQTLNLKTLEKGDLSIWLFSVNTLTSYIGVK